MIVVRILVPKLALALTLALAGCGGSSSNPKTQADSVGGRSDEIPTIPEADLSGMEAGVRTAIDQARAAVESNRTSASTWGRYAMVLDAHDRPVEAQPCYARAAALDGGNPRWTYLRAVLADQAGADLAIFSPLFEHAQRAAPRDAAVRVRYGDALMKRGRREDARKAYAEAVTLAPDLAMGQRRLGEVLLALGDIDGAIAALEASERLHAGSPAVLSALARACIRGGREEDAQRYSDAAQAGGADALLVDPMRAEVGSYAQGTQQVRRRALALFDAGRFAEAVPLLESVVQARPTDSFACTRLAICHQELGDLNRAYQTYRRTLAINESNAFAHFSFGAMLSGSTRTDEAMKHLDRAIELDSSNSLAHAKRGMLLGRLSRFDESLEAFRAADAAGTLAAPDLSNWGITLLSAGKPAEAVEVLRRAVAAQPGYLNARFQLGRAYEATGDRDEAIRQFQAVIIAEPEHRPAQDALRRLRG